jgi:hypothetical protein
MSLIESIHHILQKAAGRQPGEKEKDDGPGGPSGPALQSHEDPERLQQILDGMGTGTARLVIDKEASRKISEQYALEGLSNRGRYYVARVVRPDGSMIDELLVDKQNGNVQFLGRGT